MTNKPHSNTEHFGDKTMTSYGAVSHEGFLYGRGESEIEAEENGIEAWENKWGGDADPVPEFDIKEDDGIYDE